MTNVQNFKRLLLLHLLGIPIEEPYDKLLPKTIEYFAPVKTMEINDLDDELNICAVNKHNKLVYGIFKDGGTMQMIVSKSFVDYVSSVLPYTYLNDDTLNRLAHAVLTYNKVEFDGLYISHLNDSNSNYFNSLIKRYEKGDYKMVKV